jgi:hypothetical protein
VRNFEVIQQLSDVFFRRYRPEIYTIDFSSIFCKKIIESQQGVSRLVLQPKLKYFELYNMIFTRSDKVAALGLGTTNIFVLLLLVLLLLLLLMPVSELIFCFLNEDTLYARCV